MYAEEQKAHEERQKAMHDFQVEQQHVHERQVAADEEHARLRDEFLHLENEVDTKVSDAIRHAEQTVA